MAPSEERADRQYAEIKLTRQAVARQEIDAALSLLFSCGGESAIHLLAWAACEVLRGVAKQKGVTTFLSLFDTYIKAEKIKEFRKLIKESYNFFKHSNDDPDKVLDNFRPESSTIVLFAAIDDYSRLYGKMSFPMMIFRAWFLVRNPNFLKDDYRQVFEAQTISLRDVATKPFRDSLRSASDVFRMYEEDPGRVLGQFAQHGSIEA